MQNTISTERFRLILQYLQIYREQIDLDRQRCTGGYGTQDYEEHLHRYEAELHGFNLVLRILMGSRCRKCNPGLVEFSSGSCDKYEAILEGTCALCKTSYRKKMNVNSYKDNIDIEKDI